MKDGRRVGIRHYFSLVKFGHTIFALPFAGIGFMLGEQEKGFQFNWKTGILILLCMIFARNAAMAFNRWADREIDSMNPRTLIREIPAGIIKSGEALLFTILNIILFCACTYFINTICFFLSPVALLIILGYSYTKRFTALCHLVLGLGLSLAPIGAFLAITGYFSITPVLLSLGVFGWVTGFDIIYALQDEAFDKSQRLHSIPVLLGKKKALRLSEGFHAASSLFLFAVGFKEAIHPVIFIGWIAFTCLLIYQHLIVKPDDLSRVNIAFFTTNGIGSVVFACFAIAGILL